ncbi:hypothetical protein DESUT3_12180 [Desulfuromonas versatilis]|uniref:Uncharacterized protein n=1 Tax=Desulfuromonas versatilis TaxID=2802975 RepID=A0ABM8HU30_9BACT|nr:hypothetical protein [Desulfuromonas versatilis]BCR04149.1 hypothetical protein DESUT3_12180 [Desulfuromonas versatilis]
MTGKEILQELATQRRSDHQFIKWWRKENDFADYELIDNFIKDARPDQEFAGYSLLSIDQMWDLLTRMIPGQVKREVRTRGGDVVIWTREGTKGESQTHECPYIPESLMTIFDVTTRGNPIDR